jgi:hypothetical protein
MFGVACDSRIPQANLHVVFTVVLPTYANLVSIVGTGTVVSQNFFLKVIKDSLLAFGNTFQRG